MQQRTAVVAVGTRDDVIEPDVLPSTIAEITPPADLLPCRCYIPNQRARRLDPKFSLSARMATEGS